MIGPSLPLLLALLFPCFGGPPEDESWPQWGGVRRDFRPRCGNLVESWPEEGPRILWRRTLGRGCSAILVDGESLFTVYRKNGEEIVVALDRETGKALWEHRDPVPDTDLINVRFVTGPNATPLLAGGRVFAVGATARLRCLDQKTGRLLWRRDLRKEFDASRPGHGYSSSPIAHEGRVIAAVGGKGKSLVAFRQEDGTVVWQRQDAENSYGSPVMIRVGGEHQLLAPMKGTLLSVDPGTGELRWSRNDPDRKMFIGTPLRWEGGRLFVPGGSNRGGRLLELHGEKGETRIRERWKNRKVTQTFTNAVWINGMICVSTSPGEASSVRFLRGIDVETGDILWTERTPPAHLLAVGDRLILLDVDGNLSLATPTRAELVVHCQSQVLDSRCWAPPSLVKGALYLRDEKSILALDLGAPGDDAPSAK